MGTFSLSSKQNKKMVSYPLIFVDVLKGHEFLSEINFEPLDIIFCIVLFLIIMVMDIFLSSQMKYILW